MAGPPGRAQLRFHLARAHRPRPPAQRGSAHAADVGSHPRIAAAAWLENAGLRRDHAAWRRQGHPVPGRPHARLGTAPLRARGDLRALHRRHQAAPAGRRPADACAEGRCADSRKHVRQAPLPLRRPRLDSGGHRPLVPAGAGQPRHAGPPVPRPRQDRGGHAGSGPLWVRVRAGKAVRALRPRLRSRRPLAAELGRAGRRAGAGPRRDRAAIRQGRDTATGPLPHGAGFRLGQRRRLRAPLRRRRHVRPVRPLRLRRAG